MIEIQKTPIPGLLELQGKVLQDPRGHFQKFYQTTLYQASGLRTDFHEEFWSHSHKGVVRGMHFQVPPHDHTKLVFCVNGEVQDVVIDLRVGSPTYQHVYQTRLSAKRGNMLYIPEGLAHGFCALQDSTMVYKVTREHSPQHNQGILWESIPIQWELQGPPIVSQRDQNLPPLETFTSPFQYPGEP